MIEIIINMLNIEDVDDFKSFKKKLAKNLKELRRSRKNISQFKLSLLCDIDKNIPSLIETATISVGLETLYRISKALRYHPSVFLLDMDKDKDIIDLINSRYNDYL